MSLRSGKRPGPAVWSRRLAALVLVCLGVTFGIAPSAGADVFGQTDTWGTFGEGPGEIFDPWLMGVDAADGSVYVLDTTTSFENYRIQKFSEDGTPAPGSALLPFEVGGEFPSYEGIAVNHSLGRFYLLQYTAGSDTATGKAAVEKLRVFSTTPVGGVFEEETPLPVPSPTGLEALDEPRDLAVDPTNGDLVILAQDAAGHVVVQRIKSNGTPGSRFVDSTDVLKPNPVVNWGTALAVQDDGTVYLLSADQSQTINTNQQAWELPATGPQVLSKVPGFEALRQKQGPQRFDLAQGKENGQMGNGPSIAVSTDGTLYWKRTLNETNDLSEPGDYAVQAFSQTSGKVTAIYGGGSSSCRISYPFADLAGVGSKLLVFDQGPVVGEVGTPPPYGVEILTFGAGGTGCRRAVDGISPTHGAATGATEVTVTGLNFDNGITEVKFGSAPAASFEIKSPTEVVATSPAGIAGETVHVTVIDAGGSSEATKADEFSFDTAKTNFKLTVKKVGTGTVTSTPAGISCGFTCEAQFEEGSEVELAQVAGVGFEFVKWTGACTGNGACKVPMGSAQEATAEFKAKAKPKFKLTVSKSGAGSGTVTSTNPAGGINCGSDCEQEYESGTVVTLGQGAASGSEFKEWTGACSGAGACQVTISAASSVGARFEPVSTTAPPPTCATNRALCPTTPKPKPLHCKRGFKKKKVHGKPRCVRIPKTHHKKGAHHR